MSRKTLLAYCLAVGSLDALTGVALVSAPSFTLRLMGVPELPPADVFVRWVGVFVAGVGASYLYPFVLAPRARAARLVVILEVTALLRTVVGTFVTVCLASGLLARSWTSVPLTDLSLAALQLWMLAGGRRRRAVGG